MREAKNLSQGEIEKRTGLLRAYTSRVEHGHTLCSSDRTLENTHALEIPLYRLFTDDDQEVLKLRQPKHRCFLSWGTSAVHDAFLNAGEGVLTK